MPHLAWVAFRGQDFRDFAALLKRLHEALAREKLRPFAFLASTGVLGAPLRPCAACGLEPARRDEPGSLCPDCEREAALGARLPRSDRVGFFLEEAPRPYLDFPGLKVGLGGPLEGPSTSSAPGWTSPPGPTPRRPSPSSATCPGWSTP